MQEVDKEIDNVKDYCFLLLKGQTMKIEFLYSANKWTVCLKDIEK